MLVDEGASDRLREAEIEKGGPCIVFHMAKRAGAFFARPRIAGEYGHPAWSGLSVNRCWMRRVENQDVEFVHATRKPLQRPNRKLLRLLLHSAAIALNGAHIAT